MGKLNNFGGSGQGKLKIVIAPNAFKNSLSAQEATEAIESGLAESGLSADYECFPIADGGDGTASLIMSKCGGQIIEVDVHDPLGRPIRANLGVIHDGNTAIIEMADASGLRLLKPEELDPMKASSFGTGELIRKALDLGVKEIFLCMGGSATVDGGTGILRALGLRFMNQNGSSLENLPRGWESLHSVDFAGLDPRLQKCQIKILCDVENTLLGDQGAAAVFGPQKGAGPQQVHDLDNFLQRFTAITRTEVGVNLNNLPFSGTAGGAAAGLSAYLNAKLLNGIEHFLALTNFAETLSDSDLLITGEGALDAQTLQGKGPLGVAKVARSFGIPVVALAGKVAFTDLPELRKHFTIVLPIANQPMSLREALELTKANLSRTARELGACLQLMNLSNQNQ